MTCLSSVPTTQQCVAIYRLARIDAPVEFLSEREVDHLGIQEIESMIDSIGAHDSGYSVSDFLNGPFRQRQTMRDTRPTRFSDGSFRVFDASLEPETAEIEVGHWARLYFLGKPTGKRTLFYQEFVCTFSGKVKNIRSKAVDWKQLTHPNDYKFCNRLGACAIKLDLDALLTPSVRHPRGTNVPVFTRSALRDPVVVSNVMLKFDDRAQEVNVIKKDPYSQH